MSGRNQQRGRPRGSSSKGREGGRSTTPAQQRMAASRARSKEDVEEIKAKNRMYDRKRRQKKQAEARAATTGGRNTSSMMGRTNQGRLSARATHNAGNDDTADSEELRIRRERNRRYDHTRRDREEAERRNREEDVAANEILNSNDLRNLNFSNADRNIVTSALLPAEIR